MLLLLFLLLLLACLVSLVLEGSFFQALPSCCFQPSGSLRLFLLLRRKPVLVFAACLWLLRNFLLPLATCGCCPFHSVFCCSLVFMLLLLFLACLLGLSGPLLPPTFGKAVLLFAACGCYPLVFMFLLLLLARLLGFFGPSHTLQASPSSKFSLPADSRLLHALFVLLSCSTWICFCYFLVPMLLLLLCLLACVLLVLLALFCYLLFAWICSLQLLSAVSLLQYLGLFLLLPGANASAVVVLACLCFVGPACSVLLFAPTQLCLRKVLCGICS